MIKSILVCFILSVVVFANLDDEEFLKKFNVRITKRGQFQHNPQKGDNVKVHYTGRLQDGTEFDSSKGKAQAFQFRVGVGQVIKCWDQVVLQLTLGDEVTITCPSELAYGAKGAGGMIPPNAILDFDIQMLGFREHKIEDL